MDVKAHNFEGLDYAKDLEKTLERTRKMLTCLRRESELLQNYVEFGPDGPEDELKKVQADIKIIRNIGEIGVLERTIALKTKYFDEYMDDFVKVEAEANERLERLMNIALKSTKPVVQKIFANRNLEEVLKNREARVHLYKQLKKHV